MMTFDADNIPQGMIFGAHGYFDTASDNRLLMFVRVNKIDNSIDWINYFNPTTVPIDPDVPPFVVNVRGKVFVAQTSIGATGAKGTVFLATFNSLTFGTTSQK
jgi:hypothetical protein